MKLIYILSCLLLLLWNNSMTAQQKDWQWIKQGGASIEGDETEEAYDIATDSEKIFFYTNRKICQAYLKKLLSLYT